MAYFQCNGWKHTKFLALVSTFLEIFSFLELQSRASVFAVGGYHRWQHFMQWYVRYFDFAADTYVPRPEDVGNMFAETSVSLHRSQLACCASLTDITGVTVGVSFVKWTLMVVTNTVKPSGHYMYRTAVTICTAQWSLYVPHSGHYMYRTAVTICTAQWSLYVPPV